jgi:SAM-dependent methyltransferase
VIDEAQLGPASSPAPATTTTCPVCGAPRERALLTVEDLPVNCSALHRDADAARTAPRGTLELSVCDGCGYVRNRAFDPAILTYTEEYENALDFSPRFRAFRDELADELFERYHLDGRDVLEFGCGQGAFLASLCRDGRARGVGFDPSHRAGDEPLPATVSVEPSYFDPATDATPADLFCARHVLEHLPEPLGFLQGLHPAVWRRSAALYLEVPSGNAVFGGDGCWDLIYQHVSYFSASALVRLLERAGYGVTDVRERFGDQYLSVEARADARSTVTAPDPRTFVERAVAGAASLRDRLEAARARIRAEHDAGRAVAVWGAGAKAVTFLALLGDAPVAAAVDLNPRKLGTFLPGCGLEVTAPASLASVRPSAVYIFNPVYRDEISSSLADMGLDAEVIIP